MEPESPSKSKLHTLGFLRNPNLIKSCITLLIILVLVSVGGYFIFKQTNTRVVYYTVMLDCGSTGSRVNVYKWTIKNGANFPVLLHTYPDNLTKSDGCQYHCMQTEPGLDKFVGNASGVRESIEPLIHWAEQWVPLESRSETGIFILATAGMRRLRLEHSSKVLADVKDVVKEHGFLYNESWIRVLTGKEEAYYGWVALNYKMGFLRNGSNSSMLGLLDLGGSSLQVVAESDELIEIGSFGHRVSANSWPEFGMNEAFDRTVILLSHTEARKERDLGGFEVKHPCLGLNFVQNYTCSACFGQENSTSLVLKGDFDWGRCKRVVRAVAINASSLESSRLEDNLSCIGDNNTMVKLTQHSQSTKRYHALSGFFAVYNTLNLSSRANLTKMWEIEHQICSTSWAMEDQTNIHKKQYCFRAAYMTSLIEDGLCLGNTEIIFGPGDVSWTLGAALVEGEYLRRNIITESRSFISTVNFNEMISSPFLLFVLLLCLLIFVYRSQIKFPMPGRKVSSGGGGRLSLPSYISPKRPR